MIIYTHPKYDHVQEVDPRETVRIRLLERAGWSVRAATMPDSPQTVFDVFDPKLADLLYNAGFGVVDSVRLASDDDLLAINGIGEAKLAHIREVISGG